MSSRWVFKVKTSAVKYPNLSAIHAEPVLSPHDRNGQIDLREDTNLQTILT